MVATSCDLNAPRCTTTVLAGTLTHLSLMVFVGRSIKDRLATPCNILKSNVMTYNYKPKREV